MPCVHISSAELCRINEHQKVALDLDPYVKKLLNARRRVVLVNNILQNAQVKDTETWNIKHQSCTSLSCVFYFIFSNVCFRNVCGGWTIMLLRRQHEGRPCLRHQEHLPHALPANHDVLLLTFWECTITLCSMPRTNAVDSQNLPHIVKGHWAMQSTATAELMSVHLRVVGETAVYICTHFFVQHMTFWIKRFVCMNVTDAEKCSYCNALDFLIICKFIQLFIINVRDSIQFNVPDKEISSSQFWSNQWKQIIVLHFCSHVESSIVNYFLTIFFFGYASLFMSHNNNKKIYTKCLWHFLSYSSIFF